MPILSKQNLKSKLAIFLLFILLAFLGNLKYQQWKNQKKIEAEKQSLQKQADSLMKKNNELSESLEYINSPNFKERVARQQLNLKKEGETVYSFIELKNTNENTEQQNKGESNASKWWNYFFVN